MNGICQRGDASGIYLLRVSHTHTHTHTHHYLDCTLFWG